MKFKTLSAVALLAVVGVATTAPSLVSAATPSSQTSPGTLEVTAGGLVNPDDPGIVDPEKPTDPVLPTNPDGPIRPNPTDPGDKGIIGVSDLNFGSITIGKTTASAATTVSGTKNRGAMVSFGDVTGEYKGYTISGELTTQFSNGTTTLTGATIAFINPIVSTNGEGTIATTGQSMSQTLGFGADTGGGSKTFITAAAGEGSGQWTMEFGQSIDHEGTTVDTTASSVNLTIPTKVANSMTKGTYTAVVTWTMGALA